MQESAANIILGLAGPGDRFTLKYGIFRFRLKIKPLSAKQLIAISKEVSQIGKLDETKEMFPGLMENINDARHLSRAIAIATGTRWKRIVARAVLKLPLNDIKTLFKIVHKQSDPEPFFFTIILAKGRLNLLKQPEQ